MSDLFDLRRCDDDEPISFEDYSINECWDALLYRAGKLQIELPEHFPAKFDVSAARDLSELFWDRAQSDNLFGIEADEDAVDDPLYCHELTVNLIMDAQALIED